MDNSCPPHHYGDGNRCNDRHCFFFMQSRRVAAAPMYNAMYTAPGQSRFAPPPRNSQTRFHSHNDSRFAEQHRPSGRFAMSQPMPQARQGLEDYAKLESENGSSTIGYTPEMTWTSGQLNNLAAMLDGQPTGSNGAAAFRQAHNIGAHKQPQHTSNFASATEYPSAMGPHPNEALRSLPAAQSLPSAGELRHNYDPLPKLDDNDDIDFLHSHFVGSTAQDYSRMAEILARMHTKVPKSDQDSTVDRLSKLLDGFEAVPDLLTTLTKRMESLEKCISQMSADSDAPATQSSPFLRPIKNRNAIKITDADGNPVEFGTERKA